MRVEYDMLRLKKKKNYLSDILSLNLGIKQRNEMTQNSGNGESQSDGIGKWDREGFRARSSQCRLEQGGRAPGGAGQEREHNSWSRWGLGCLERNIRALSESLVVN